MTFFFFLVVVGMVIAVSVWKERRKQVSSTFATAASRLGLILSSDGTALQRPWIYGEIDHIRVDVRPFTKVKDGARSTWTGYRLTLPERIDPSLAGDDDPKRRLLVRLTNRFAECSIGDDELYAARSAMAENSSRLVSDVEYLLGAARELMTTEEETSSPTLPPPLPKRPDRDSADTAPSDPLPQGDDGETEEAIFHTVVIEEAIAAAESADSPVEAESLPPRAEGTPEPSPVAQESPVEPEPKTGEETDIGEEPAGEDPLSPLESAARELFDCGLTRYELGRRFEQDYRGRSIEGFGELLRVDRFSNDRYLGRGPGFVAEVGIRSLENPTGGLSRIVALVQLPGGDESGIDLGHWRERLGETVAVCGSPVHCDPFTGKLYLCDGLVDSPFSAA